MTTYTDDEEVNNLLRISLYVQDKRVDDHGRGCDDDNYLAQHFFQRRTKYMQGNERKVLNE